MNVNENNQIMDHSQKVWEENSERDGLTWRKGNSFRHMLGDIANKILTESNDVKEKDLKSYGGGSTTDGFKKFMGNNILRELFIDALKTKASQNDPNKNDITDFINAIKNSRNNTRVEFETARDELWNTLMNSNSQTFSGLKNYWPLERRAQFISTLEKQYQKNNNELNNKLSEISSIIKKCTTDPNYTPNDLWKTDAEMIGILEKPKKL